MPFENLLEKIDEYGEFVKYCPTTPIQIFEYQLDNRECEIQISKALSKETIAPILIDYLKWLAWCENEVKCYFAEKLNESLPTDWFQSIEVYNADITFVTSEDFGAVITLGESIFPDHIVELYFEKYEIVDDGLIG